MALHRRLGIVLVALALSIPIARAAEPVPDALIGRIKQIEFKDVRLADALDRVAKEQKLSLDVRWEELEEIRISPDTRVSTKMRNVSVGRTLHALLNSPEARIEVLDNGHVLITSKALLYRAHTTERRYDTTFLLANAKDEAVLREQTESLSRMIKDSISRESWDGEGVHINPEAGGLLIAQTEQNHRAIVTMLERLHEQRINRDGAAMNEDELKDASEKHPWLNQKVGELAFHGTQLAGAIDALSKASGRSIFVNWQALEKIRVVKTLPVTTDLSNRTVREALDKLMADVGGSQARVAYTSFDQRAVISSADDLQINVATRVYDIRQGIRGDATRNADIAAIMNRVCGIDPLSWRDAGGRVGSVRELAGQLIVTQTPEVHRRIADELKDILPQ